jgi:hypothetical protein
MVRCKKGVPFDSRDGRTGKAPGLEGGGYSMERVRVSVPAFHPIKSVRSPEKI